MGRQDATPVGSDAEFETRDASNRKGRRACIVEGAGLDGGARVGDGDGCHVRCPWLPRAVRGNIGGNWRDLRNGKGVMEDIASNIIKMVVNQDFSSGLEPGPLTDHFPYLSPPPPAS